MFFFLLFNYVNWSHRGNSRFIRHFEKGVNITLQNTGIAKKLFGTSILALETYDTRQKILLKNFEGCIRFKV